MIFDSRGILNNYAHDKEELHMVLKIHIVFKRSPCGES